MVDRRFKEVQFEVSFTVAVRCETDESALYGFLSERIRDAIHEIMEPGMASTDAFLVMPAKECVSGTIGGIAQQTSEQAIRVNSDGRLVRP